MSKINFLKFLSQWDHCLFSCYKHSAERESSSSIFEMWSVCVWKRCVCVCEWSTGVQISRWDQRVISDVNWVVVPGGSCTLGRLSEMEHRSPVLRLGWNIPILSFLIPHNTVLDLLPSRELNIFSLITTIWTSDWWIQSGMLSCWIK